MSRFDVFNDIAHERNRQDDIWGPQNGHPLEKWLTILTEEVGELAHDILEYDNAKARSEAIQVAAVAAAIAEHIDEGTYAQ